MLHGRYVTAASLTLIRIRSVRLLFIIYELFVLIEQTLFQFIVRLRILSLARSLRSSLIALEVLQGSMRVALVCSVRSHYRALARCNQFALLASPHKFGAMLARVRGKLVMNLNVVEAGVVGYFIHWLKVVVADRLAVEIDWSWR